MKKKMFIGLIVSSVVCLSSICVFANQFANQDEYNIETEITTNVSNDGFQTKIYTLEEIEKIMNELDIQPYNVEYIAESESISGKTNVNKTIQLTSEYKYGKVFYSNNSSKDVTLSVPEADISVTVPAGKGLGKTWVKSGIGSKKTYTVSVSSDGSVNLDGKLSVAKSNVKGELK